MEMGKFLKKFLIPWVFLQMQVLAFAQQDLRPEEVQVVTDYTPQVADAVKVNFTATIPERETGGQMELFYNTPVRLLQTPFSPAPLRPLAIGKETQERLPMSYFKAGFGTQLSPLFEALWNDGDYQKAHYGVFFRHFSSRALKINHQDYNQNYISAFATFYSKKIKLHSQLEFEREAVFYYGYDHSDTSFRKKDIRQRFNDMDWKLQLNNLTTKNDFSYDAKFGYGFFGDNNKVLETGPWMRADLVKIFRKKHYVSVFLKEDLQIFKNNDESETRNIFTFKPRYEFNDGTWKIFGAVDLTWENGIFHLFPDMGMERGLYEKYIIMYSGYRMELLRTSYESLTNENPWINDDFELHNSWFEDRFGGFKGTVKNFSYNLRIAQKLIRRLPLFLNDPDDMKMFDVIYDKRTIILNFQSELFYRATNNLRFSSTFNFFNYEMDTTRAWHLPNFKFDFNTQYSIKEKIYLTLDLLARDGGLARLEDGTTTELGGTFDINLGATYKFSDRFSFFLQLNNLASIKYERYYHYPTYGFNAMAGAIFRY